MKKLKRIKDKYYTQNKEGLSIKERVFFLEGMVANIDEFRIATEQEILDWKKYKEDLENGNISE